MGKEKLYLASDHGGYLIKRHLTIYLHKLGYEIIDLGTHGEESVDYPDYAHKLAGTISDSDKGIAICGSGIGISIALNRHRNIRAALCHNEEMAKLSRLHNDANICVLPGRFVSLTESEKIVDAFLVGSFEGGRHKQRIEKINRIDL